jgi:UDP-N-acetyl-D-mannosaminuronate dehydrogenase
MAKNKSESCVIGLGEVGSAIQRIFNADGYDIKNVGVSDIPKQYDYLHICIPYSDNFIKFVEIEQAIHSPKYTIIHSTVPVGTSRKCKALHSPIRGLHPNLYEGIMTFEKFIGGEKASEVADVFRKAGLKVILCDKQETTELGKLLDTEYYRACIEFTKHAGKLSYAHDVPFHEVYTLFNMTYNQGYKKLGHEEYVRPVLQNINTPIGGHCVTQNAKLL